MRAVPVPVPESNEWPPGLCSFILGVVRLAQMGKASQWLRNLLLSGRKGRKAKDRAEADCQSVLSAPLPSHAQAAATPHGREKRRWSFRRPGAAASSSQGPLASSSSHCFSEAELHVVVVQQEQGQQQAADAAVPEAASTSGTVVALPASGRRTRRRNARGGGRGGEAAAAAVKIQSAFRSYLVRAFLGPPAGRVQFSAPAILHAASVNVKCEQ